MCENLDIDYKVKFSAKNVHKQKLYIFQKPLNKRIQVYKNIWKIFKT